MCVFFVSAACAGKNGACEVGLGGPLRRSLTDSLEFTRQNILAIYLTAVNWM